MERHADASAVMAEFAATMEYGQIPVKVVEHSIRLIVNVLAAGLWGRITPPGQQVEQVLTSMQGAPESAVLGSAVRLPAPAAAAIHAACAFATKSDDTHGPAQLHPSQATVFPALADGERQRSSGQEVLAAIVAATEVGVRIGLASGPHQDMKHNSMRMGFWSTVRTPFCAAVASGRVQRLRVGEMAHALGIAATSSSGLLADAGYGPPPHRYRTGSVYAWDAGRAVMMGTLAARLAGAGMTVGPHVLDGQRGWVRVFTGGHGDLRALSDGLGRTYETERVSLKLHCMSHTILPVVDAAADLAVKHRFDLTDIAEVLVRGPAYVLSNMWRTDVETFEDAVCSAPFAIAMVLVDPEMITTPGKILSRLSDRNLHDLMARFRFVVDPAIEMTGGQLPGSITVVMKDGSSVSADSEAVTRGTYPSRPVSEAIIDDKFLTAAVRHMPETQAREALRMVRNLPDIDDVGKLALVLSSPAPRRARRS